MEDLKALDDVQLAELWLARIVLYPEGMRESMRFEEEAKSRGAERMKAAYRLIGERREAARQMPLELDAPESDVTRAFADGRLYLLVDTPVRSSGHRDASVCGGEAADADGMVTWVHVISRPAGGEVRGYAKVDDELRLRMPAYPLDWPEVDAEVCRRLGCSRVVTP